MNSFPCLVRLRVAMFQIDIYGVGIGLSDD